MGKLSRIWKEFRKKDRTKDYVRFQISQNIKLDSQSNYTVLTADVLRQLCLKHTSPSTVVWITEPKMKVFPIETVNRLVGIWKHNIHSKARFTEAWEGPAYRFLGLVRGDYHFASTAMGIAWVNEVIEAYPSSIDMAGEMVQEADIFQLGSFHVLNFFVCQGAKVLWVEPQRAEIMGTLIKYRAKKMLL